jgi:hypothetical protein
MVLDLNLWIKYCKNFTIVSAKLYLGSSTAAFQSWDPAPEGRETQRSKASAKNCERSEPGSTNPVMPQTSVTLWWPVSGYRPLN